MIALTRCLEGAKRRWLCLGRIEIRDEVAPKIKSGEEGRRRILRALGESSTRSASPDEVVNTRDGDGVILRKRSTYRNSDVVEQRGGDEVLRPWFQEESRTRSASADVGRLSIPGTSAQVAVVPERVGFADEGNLPKFRCGRREDEILACLIARTESIPLSQC